MRASRRGTVVGLAGALAFGAVARGDFIGMAWEEDELGLDGVTPLETIPGYLEAGSPRVFNFYAEFDDPADQCLGVIGSAQTPFIVATADGVGFVNSTVPSDQAPLFGLVGAVPSLNWDSFYTIGLKSSGPGSPDGPGNLSDELIAAPGTPGPNADPWGGTGNTNMAWTVPPMIDGAPTPQSVAGNFPAQRILVMRLVVPAYTDIVGQFDLFWRSGQSGEFFQVGVPIGPLTTEGACCYPDGSCGDFVAALSCIMSGGVPLGIGTECGIDACPSGACCLPDGSCALLDETGCLDEGGLFQGIGSQCNEVICVGACCLPGGCLDGLSQADCETVAAGSWVGPGSTCAGTTCPAPCPADVNGDGAVNVQDLVEVILAWGMCPL